MKKVWFITGCSTGFGRELAKEVLKDGYRAVVTARKPEDIQDIVADFPATLLNVHRSNKNLTGPHQSMILIAAPDCAL